MIYIYIMSYISNIYTYVAYIYIGFQVFMLFPDAQFFTRRSVKHCAHTMRRSEPCKEGMQCIENSSQSSHMQDHLQSL